MDMKPKETSINARIHGRVQGVWFRRWAESQARQLGLRGWVRNRLDGTVEAEFEGDQDRVDQMIEACEVGPPNAYVQAVDLTPCGEYHPSPFKVRRTK